MTYIHDMTGRHIYDKPSQWLERCLDIMALDPETANESVGLPCGLHRPELGPAIQDLQCVNCEATWAGVVGDPCWWCENALRRQAGYQIDLLLKAPETDPDDARYEGHMNAWTRRLINGVAAELITQAQADTAWARAVRKAAASRCPLMVPHPSTPALISTDSSTARTGCYMSASALALPNVPGNTKPLSPGGPTSHAWTFNTSTVVAKKP